MEAAPAVCQRLVDAKNFDTVVDGPIVLAKLGRGYATEQLYRIAIALRHDFIDDSVCSNRTSIFLRNVKSQFREVGLGCRRP